LSLKIVHIAFSNFLSMNLSSSSNTFVLIHTFPEFSKRIWSYQPTSNIHGDMSVSGAVRRALSTS
jgi:hypothetical protein